MTRHRQPEALRLATAISGRIAAGVYAPGSWLPTERGLAAEFDVTRGVVRGALVHLEHHGEIVRDPGKRPWVSERHARGGASDAAVRLQTVAAVLPQQSVFVASLAILNGINQALQAEETPYRLVVFHNDGVAHWRRRQEAPYELIGPSGASDAASSPAELEGQALANIAAEGIAGVVLWPLGGRASGPDIERLRQRGVPIVFVDRVPFGIDGDFVGVDNRGSAREAVEFLLDEGHRRIALITETPAAMTTNERAAGYRQAMRAAGLYRTDLEFAVPSGAAPGQAPADYFLGLADVPTAVFANNDYLAYALIADLERRGLVVPDAMSVMGFDDLDRFSPRPPHITTMRQPFERIGERAAGLLMARLAAGEAAPAHWQHIELPTALQIRKTCRPIVASSALAAAGRAESVHAGPAVPAHAER